MTVALWLITRQPRWLFLLSRCPRTGIAGNWGQEALAWLDRVVQGDDTQECNRRGEQQVGSEVCQQNCIDEAQGRNSSKEGIAGHGGMLMELMQRVEMDPFFPRALHMWLLQSEDCIYQNPDSGSDPTARAESQASPVQLRDPLVEEPPLDGSIPNPM